jgi:hypothetical protein
MDCICSILVGDDNPEELKTAGKFTPPCICKDTGSATRIMG